MSESIEARAHALELNKKRLQAWEEGKALLDEVAKRGDGMSGEEQEKWERINGEIDRLDRERDVYLTAERRERESAELREADMRDFGERQTEQREIAEAMNLRAWLLSGGRDERGQNVDYDIPVVQAMRERELMRSGLDASEARALAWDTGSVASAVPVTTARSLYQYMEGQISMFRLPTTKVVTTTGEQMKFPRLAAHAIATQVSGQGTALAGTDPTFLSMTLDAYKYGELVIAASEVVQDTVVNMQDFILRDIGRALGRKIDTDLVAGTGSGAPQGVTTAAIVGSAGTIATGGTLITPTYENLVDVVYSVNDAYRSGGNAAWLMNDRTAGVVRKLRDQGGGTIGAAMWDPSQTVGISGGQPDRLLGFPVYTDPNVASCASNAKVAVFGDWSAYYVRTVGSVQLDRDDSRYFDTDQIGFRGKWRVDGDVIDLTALNLLKQSV